jgi:hypothetical protein
MKISMRSALLVTGLSRVVFTLLAGTQFGLGLMYQAAKRVGLRP